MERERGWEKVWKGKSLVEEPSEQCRKGMGTERGQNLDPRPLRGKTKNFPRQGPLSASQTAEALAPQFPLGPPLIIRPLFPPKAQIMSEARAKTKVRSGEIGTRQPDGSRWKGGNSHGTVRHSRMDRPSLHLAADGFSCPDNRWRGGLGRVHARSFPLPGLCVCPLQSTAGERQRACKGPLSLAFPPYAAGKSSG